MIYKERVCFMCGSKKGVNYTAVDEKDKKVKLICHKCLYKISAS